MVCGVCVVCGVCGMWSVFVCGEGCIPYVQEELFNLAVTQTNVGRF